MIFNVQITQYFINDFLISKYITFHHRFIMSIYMTFQHLIYCYKNLKCLTQTHDFLGTTTHIHIFISNHLGGTIRQSSILHRF